jgi:hypothetical protein
MIRRGRRVGAAPSAPTGAEGRVGELGKAV